MGGGAGLIPAAPAAAGLEESWKLPGSRTQASLLGRKHSRPRDLQHFAEQIAPDSRVTPGHLAHRARGDAAFPAAAPSLGDQQTIYSICSSLQISK